MPRKSIAKKKKSEEPFEPMTIDEPIQVQDPEWEQIAQAIQGLPSERAYISLYRFPEGNFQGGRPAFVADVEPAGFRPSIIQERYGGGRWKYKVVKDGSIVQGGEFTVEGPRKSIKPDQDKPAPVPDSYGGVSEAITRMNGLLEQMIKRQSDDTLKMVMGLMTTMLASQPKVNPDAIRAQMVDELRALKDVTGGGSGDFAKMFVEALRTGMELSAEMSAGGESPILGLLLSKLGPFLDGLTKGPVSVKGPMPVSSSPSPPPSPSPDSVERQNVPRAEPISGIRAAIAQYKPMFVQAAAKDADPGLYADLILDQCSAEEKTTLSAWMEKETWFEDVKKEIPEAAFQARWWAELRGAIKEAITETDTHVEVRESGETANAG